jgi:cytoskeleton protein RodZ
MNSFSNELRSERESRNITLAEIAKKTKINIKYLEAIEQGAFDVLPQTYVRAFLKSYADIVGIPASEVLYKYDIMVTRAFSDPAQPYHVEAPVAIEASPETHEKIKREKRARHTVMISGFLVVAALFGLYLYDSISSSLAYQHVQETPFQEVILDQEQHTPLPLTDTLPAETPLQAIAPIPDSLHLRVAASDSVWITIVRDSLPVKAGYLLRGRYRTYHALYEFRISLSNAGAVTLTLNGKTLQPLGKKGERIRNYAINANLLHQ